MTGAFVVYIRSILSLLTLCILKSGQRKSGVKPKSWVKLKVLAPFTHELFCVKSYDMTAQSENTKRIAKNTLSIGCNVYNLIAYTCKYICFTPIFKVC